MTAISLSKQLPVEDCMYFSFSLACRIGARQLGVGVEDLGPQVRVAAAWHCADARGGEPTTIILPMHPKTVPRSSTTLKGF